jgi:hypothetical protein
MNTTIRPPRNVQHLNSNEAIPQGDFIAYKAACSTKRQQGYDCIITLFIPKEAEVRGYVKNLWGNLPIWDKKFRVSEAIPLSIKTKDGEHLMRAFTRPRYMFYSGELLEYVVGQLVVPKHRFDQSNTSCSDGIHAFRTEIEAQKWMKLYYTS